MSSKGKTKLSGIISGRKKAEKNMNIVEDEPENTEIDIIENDYRILMKEYDVSKNKFSNVLTKFELAVILGKRATQIASGAHTSIEYKPGMTLLQIVEEELEQRKTPYMIKRTVGNYSEFWRLDDMEINL